MKKLIDVNNHFYYIDKFDWKIIIVDSETNEQAQALPVSFNLGYKLKIFTGHLTNTQR